MNPLQGLTLTRAAVLAACAAAVSAEVAAIFGVRYGLFTVLVIFVAYVFLSHAFRFLSPSVRMGRVVVVLSTATAIAYSTIVLILAIGGFLTMGGSLRTYPYLTAFGGPVLALLAAYFSASSERAKTDSRASLLSIAAAASAVGALAVSLCMWLSAR